jgi:hypothetical protein
MCHNLSVFAGLGGDHRRSADVPPTHESSKTGEGEPGTEIDKFEVASKTS